ncbi:MAG TPA: DUF3943 domain-containing protein, partial [Thermoanaerobaculia bacterium]
TAQQRAEDPPRFAVLEGVSLIEPVLTAEKPDFSLGIPDEPKPAPVPEPVRPPGRRRFFSAASELALLEVIPWSFDRYVAREDWAFISMDTVRENFRRGFGYDSDTFKVNQTSHPYHGSLFFNAARENGYGFWESSVFTLVGSLIWECCMENSRPSTNDLVNTTLGGMTRGEVAHRISNMIIDNEATGRTRVIREIAAGVINPAALLNRLLRGEAFKKFDNSSDRFPKLLVLSTDLGYRRFRNGAHPDQWIASFSFLYGDPFEGDLSRPFDSFWVGLDASSPGGVLFTRIEERGLLKAWEVTDKDASIRHIVGFSQEYEYLNNASQVFGAQILSAGILSKYSIRESVTALTDFSIIAFPLAGIRTIDFEHQETGRYDYAPGAGARAAGRIYFGGREVLAAGYGVAFAHTVNGASRNSTLQFVRAVARIPIYGPLGAGAAYNWYSRKTGYPGFFEPRRIQSDWRVFANLAVAFR